MELRVYDVISEGDKHLVWLLDEATGQLFTLRITIKD